MALAWSTDGQPQKFCTIQCFGAHSKATGRFAGANNPRWLGGVSKDNMRYRLRQIERHPVEEAARRAVRYAVRGKRLIRQPCQVCGALKVQAHHDDYSKPLDVRWLCRSCHDREHAHARAAAKHPSSCRPAGS